MSEGDAPKEEDDDVDWRSLIEVGTGEGVGAADLLLLLLPGLTPRSEATVPRTGPKNISVSSVSSSFRVMAETRCVRTTPA